MNLLNDTLHVVHPSAYVHRFIYIKNGLKTAIYSGVLQQHGVAHAVFACSNMSAHDRRQLDKMVRTASRITECDLPPLAEIHKAKRRALDSSSDNVQI